MIIISDTGPLHYLILIDESELLREQFGRVIIPDAVLGDLQHKNTPEKVKAWIASRPEWVEVKTSSTSLSDVDKALGAGEREAIALAVELHADALLLDDRRAIREASKRNIPVITTLNILAKASEDGRIDLSEACMRLRQTSFYVSDEVIDRLLERDRQRKEAKQNQAQPTEEEDQTNRQRPSQEA
jgi:predicted nucleic acid-binding protein